MQRVHSLGKPLVGFALLHFVLQVQICLLFLVSLNFLLLHSNPLWWKWHLFLVLVLEGVVGLHRVNFSFFGINDWGIDLDYCDTEWFELETSQGHSVLFETAPRCCVSRCAHSCSLWFTGSWDVNVHPCHLLLDHIQFTLIHGPNIPGSFAVLFFKASDFTFTTRHIHNWVSFLLWPCSFILSGAISNCPLLFPSSILHTHQPGRLSFRCHIFCLFILFMGFLWQEYWSGLSLFLPVDYVLSELFTVTCPSWVPLHGMAHSFIELDKALIHVICLVLYICVYVCVCVCVWKVAAVSHVLYKDWLPPEERISIQDQRWGLTIQNFV